MKIIKISIVNLLLVFSVGGIVLSTLQLTKGESTKEIIYRQENKRLKEEIEKKNQIIALLQKNLVHLYPETPDFKPEK